MSVLRDPVLHALQVQPKEAEQFVCQERVVEQLGRESAKHQLPHVLAVHRSHLACAGLSSTYIISLSSVFFWRAGQRSERLECYRDWGRTALLAAGRVQRTDQSLGGQRAPWCRGRSCRPGRGLRHIHCPRCTQPQPGTERGSDMRNKTQTGGICWEGHILSNLFFFWKIIFLLLDICFLDISRLEF